MTYVNHNPCTSFTQATRNLRSLWEGWAWLTLCSWEGLSKRLVEIIRKDRHIQALFGKNNHQQKTLRRSWLCFALSSLWKFGRHLNLSPVAWSLVFPYSGIWIQMIVVPVQTLTYWCLEDWSYSDFSLLSLGVTGRLCSKPEHCCSDVQSVITPTIKDTEKYTRFAVPFLTCSAGALPRLLPQAISQAGSWGWRDSC